MADDQHIEAPTHSDEQLALMRQFNEACEPAPPEPLPDGISLDIDPTRYYYRRLGVVSKTGLDQIARTPAHYKAWVDGVEKVETAAFKFGKALHMAVFEPDRYGIVYVVEPDFGDMRSSKNRALRDAWRAEHPGCIPISREDDDRVVSMMAAVHRHPAASRIVTEGAGEVTLSWRDEVTGLPCKSRADYYVKHRRLAADLKSTIDASADQFARAAHSYRYHVQDALYRTGFKACGEPIDFFAIIAAEKEKPHAVAVYTLDEDAVRKGYEAARRDMDTLRACVEKDHWPSYGDGVCELSLPPWAA